MSAFVIQRWFVALLDLALVINGFALTALLLVFHGFLFLASRNHGGAVYAAGHVAVSLFLTPAFLLGVLLIPVLVRGDIERIAAAQKDPVP